jgi:hypothetical protein
VFVLRGLHACVRELHACVHHEGTRFLPAAKYG